MATRSRFTFKTDEATSQGHDTNIKSAFKKFDTVALELTDILINYKPNNKDRLAAKNELEKMIINAYKAHNTNPKNIDVIHNELLKSAEKLANSVNETHQREQNVIGSFFKTTSRLHTQIQAVINRHSMEVIQDKFFNKCA